MCNTKILNLYALQPTALVLWRKIQSRLALPIVLRHIILAVHVHTSSRSRLYQGLCGHIKEWKPITYIAFQNSAKASQVLNRWFLLKRMAQLGYRLRHTHILYNQNIFIYFFSFYCAPSNRTWEYKHLNPSFNFMTELKPKIKTLLRIIDHPINMVHLAKLFTAQLIISCNFEVSDVVAWTTYIKA